MPYPGQPIVGFIANLSPLYQSEEMLGFRAARSLRDGTLILPYPEDDREAEDAMLIVWWQGDPNRATEVLGSVMATTAVVDYVGFHSLGKEADHSTGLLAHLYQHFEVKTGANLHLPYLEDDMPWLVKVFRLAKSMGPKLAFEVLKKAAGV